MTVTSRKPEIERAETETSVATFQRDGYVVLPEVLPRSDILKLAATFSVLMNQKIARQRIAPVLRADPRHVKNDNVNLDFRPEGGNHDLNRWNMHLPSTPDFISDQLLANPRVLPIIKKLLGDRPVAFLLASDTPYPRSGFQNIHQDFPRFGITLNIALVDFTETNAPLEVWPGSHIRTEPFHTRAVSLTANEVQDLVKRIPGKRLLVKAGSFVIRDQRLVHRGTANVGSEPRPCLSIWFKSVEEFNLLGLTIPIPHRRLADRCARIGLWMREQGRSQTGRVINQKLLNWGNLFGRIVEESSGSDRDYRREISNELWTSLSSETRSLLRFASVAKSPNAVDQIRRSIVGSLILVTVLVVFLIGALFLRLKRSTPS